MKLGILNTSIVTSDGTYTLKTITPEEAVRLVVDAVAGDGIDSAVAHPATAEILTTLLGVGVPVSTQLFAQRPGQRALVFKLRGRPQGVELTKEQLEKIGYDYKILTRVA